MEMMIFLLSTGFVNNYIFHVLYVLLAKYCILFSSVYVSGPQGRTAFADWVSCLNMFK